MPAPASCPAALPAAPARPAIDAPAAPAVCLKAGASGAAAAGAGAASAAASDTTSASMPAASGMAGECEAGGSAASGASGGYTGWEGYGAALAGVLIFSMTLPMSRVAVAELDPLLVGLGRALVAAVPAGLLLWLTRSRPPRGRERYGIVLAALGVVVGWPVASTIAMQSVPAAHGAVFNGLLPLCTAAFAALGSGERPPRQFWIWALAGAALVAVFALREGGGALQAADLWLIVAVALGGMGYAEGARVSRTLGGWRTICWALVISAPFIAGPVTWMAAHAPAMPTTAAWLALAYLSFGSMFLGFFAWYHGLAKGGIARVGQVQLLQPFITVVTAGALFGEHITPATLAFALAVIGVIAAGRAAMARGHRPS